MISGFLRARLVLTMLSVILGSAAMTGCKSGGGGSDSPASGASSVPSSTASPTSGGANTAPKISGAATSSAAVNTPYSFVPTATDADGDTLSFQIQNKPSWATFNTVTGQLSGKPTAAATFADIVISTSDGHTSVALPAFSITVGQTTVSTGTGAATLAWVAPSLNEDGSALTDLAGYVIAYGPSSTTMTKSVRIDNPSIDTYMIDQLPVGTYYFGVKAVSATGAESELSSIVSKTIG